MERKKFWTDGYFATSIGNVYDNGASFYNKASEDKIKTILKDEIKIKQVIYDSCISSFEKDGKIINPLKYLESMANKDCNQALINIYPKINMKDIKKYLIVFHINIMVFLY